MKKLTAGIFAGILTIVSVNAADAAIASKAYVDQKDGVNASAISANTTEINTLKTTVGGHTTSISNLTKTVGDSTDGLVKEVADLKTSVGTGGSVADKITAALEPYSTTEEMNTELDKKQDKLTAGANIAIDATTNTISATGLATADALTTLEGKVTTNTTNIGTNTTAIGTLSNLTTTEKTNLVGAINEVKTTAGNAATKTDFDDLKSKVDNETTGLAATKAIADANKTAIEGLDASKQDKLVAGSVTGNDAAGNVITGVSAADGKITVTKGAMMPAVPASQTGVDGTLVLTAKVSGDTVIYAWESIERGTPEGGATPSPASEGGM